MSPLCSTYRCVRTRFGMFISGCLLSASLCISSHAQAQQPSPIQFTNSTTTAGIKFIHFKGNNGISITSGAASNTIGGLTSTPGTGAGNLISGNGSNTNTNFINADIYIGDSGSNNNLIEGNLVGTNAAGAATQAAAGAPCSGPRRRRIERERRVWERTCAGRFGHVEALGRAARG